MVGLCERLPLPPNYAQHFANSAAFWSVDQVDLLLWSRHFYVEEAMFNEL